MSSCQWPWCSLRAQIHYQQGQTDCREPVKTPCSDPDPVYQPLTPYTLHSTDITVADLQLTCLGHISLLSCTTKTPLINMSELVVPVTDCCWHSGWCNSAQFIHRSLLSNPDFCLELNGSAGWNFRSSQTNFLSSNILTIEQNWLFASYFCITHYLNLCTTK